METPVQSKRTSNVPSPLIESVTPARININRPGVNSKMIHTGIKNLNEEDENFYGI